MARRSQECRAIFHPAMPPANRFRVRCLLDETLVHGLPWRVMPAAVPQSNRDEPESHPPARGAGVLRDWIILVFASIHALKLLAGVIPEASRPVPVPHELAQAYEALTGSKQRWTMFETIPSYHKWRSRLVITTPDGRTRELGPLLPGFQEWMEPAPVRLYVQNERLFSGDHSPVMREACLRRLDDELRGRGLIAPGERWHLETLEDFTRHLVHIGRDGRLYERRVNRHEPPPAPAGERMEAR
ncbi:MAG TPA: hypothetical protein DIT64_02195 [Verrucomicrobiales bacterium]|nr:hypothetical protein [Verrucomicrobiales bacterium]